MDTETSLDRDVSGSGQRPAPQPSVTKTAAVYLAAAFSALSLMSSLYLAANELAVPPSLWMNELRAFDPAQLPANQDINPVNAWFANWLVEPGVNTRFAVCRRNTLFAASPTPAQPPVNCLEVIEDALKRMPASSSLWYQHASWSALEGASGESVNRSLLLSYRYGGREGWLAPRRLVFGLSRWNQLPQDLRNLVERDAWTMLQSWTQLKSLVLLYNSHLALREQLAEMVDRQATTEQKSTFFWLVEKASKGEPLP